MQGRSGVRYWDVLGMGLQSTTLTTIDCPSDCAFCILLLLLSSATFHGSRIASLYDMFSSCTLTVQVCEQVQKPDGSVRICQRVKELRVHCQDGS